MPPDPAKSPPPLPAQLSRWVWQDYLRPERGLLAVAIAMMALEGAMLGALSYLLKPMFDRVFVEGDTNALWWVGIGILVLFCVRGSASVVHKVTIAQVMERASASLQRVLLAHLMTLDTAFHQSHPPGYLIERVQGDVKTVTGAGKAIITGLARDTVAVVSLFCVAIWVDPLWTLVALLGVPLLIAPSMVAQRYTRKKAREAREVAGGLSTRLDEIFHGINPIKLNALERYQGRLYGGLLDRRVRAEVKAATGQAMIPGLVDVMTGIGFLAVLYFGGREIIAGEKTVGEFMSFFTAMALMFDPLRKLAAINGLWQAAAASLERLRALLDERPTVLSPARPMQTPERIGDLELCDVHLHYGDLPVLRGASLLAKAGQTTALVGASGAGKSTVFNVLTRLIEPQAGSVRIGGLDVGTLALADLRALFSVVTQDALLFDETIRENILLGADDVSPEALTRALEAAHVADFVAALPQGLDTVAGPRGSSLSGGQRQRVAIARALLRDAPILLLDEATSALDAASEAVVQGALDRLSAGRTTLVIAHRLSTIRNADTIIVMDKGRVVDTGSHEELLAKGGLYADLYRLQFAES